MESVETNDMFVALVNDEEQYSVWNARLRIPEGWRQVGPEQTHDDCVTFIEGLWVDMRPKSLRDATPPSAAI